MSSDTVKNCLAPHLLIFLVSLKWVSIFSNNSQISSDAASCQAKVMEKKVKSVSSTSHQDVDSHSLSLVEIS